jgi:phage shock protein A
MERAEEQAEEAVRLLGNPLLNEALDAIAARYQEQADNSQPHDQSAREDAYYMRRAVRELRTELRGVVRDFAHKRRAAQRRGLAD